MSQLIIPAPIYYICSWRVASSINQFIYIACVLLQGAIEDAIIYDMISPQEAYNIIIIIIATLYGVLMSQAVFISVDSFNHVHGHGKRCSHM